MDLKPDVTPSVISKLQAIQDRICGNRLQVDKKKRAAKSSPTFRKDYIEWTSSDEEKYDVQRKSRPIRQAAAKRSIITPDSTDDSDYEPDSWMYQPNENGNKIKRGRGRPKKPKLTEEKEIDESLLSLSKVLSRAELKKHNEKLESCDSNHVKLKRGRGRPRKIEEFGTQTEGTSSTLSFCGSLYLEDGDSVQGIFELSEELKMEDVLKDSKLSMISHEALASVYEEERNPSTDAARLGLTFGDPGHYPLDSDPSASSYSTPENPLPSTSGYQMSSRYSQAQPKPFASSGSASHLEKTSSSSQNIPLSVNIKPLLLRPTKALPSMSTQLQKTATTPSKTPSKYSKPPPPNSHSMRTRRNASLNNNDVPKELSKSVQLVPKQVSKEIVKRPKPALPSKIYVYPPIRKINSVKLNSSAQTLVKKAEASPGKTAISLQRKSDLVVVKEETLPIKMESEDIPDSAVVIPRENMEHCEMRRTKDMPGPSKEVSELEAIAPKGLAEKVIKTEEKSDFKVTPTDKPTRKVISTDDILSYCKSMSKEDLSDYDPPKKATNRRTSATKPIASLSVIKEEMQVPTHEKMSKKEVQTPSCDQPRVSTQLRTNNYIQIESPTKEVKVEMSEAYEDVLDALIERSNSEEMTDLNKEHGWKDCLTENTETRTVTSDPNARKKVTNAKNTIHSSKSNTGSSVSAERYDDLVTTPRTNDGKIIQLLSNFTVANIPTDTGDTTTNNGPSYLPEVRSNDGSKVVDESSSNFPITSVTTNTRQDKVEESASIPRGMESTSRNVSASMKKCNTSDSYASTILKASAIGKSSASACVSGSVTHDGSNELDGISTSTRTESVSLATTRRVESADNDSSNEKCPRGGYRVTTYPPLTPPPTPGKQTPHIVPRKFQVTPDKWFSCEKCGTIFKFLSTYQYHMEMGCNIKGAVQGKPPEKSNGGKGAYQCPQCPKVVATRTSLMVNE